MTTSPHQPPAGDEMPVSVLPGELAKLAVPAGVILVCAVGVHDWPVASTAAARSFWPANLILLFWIAWLVVWLCLSGRRALPLPFLPPACVWAYLGVGVLSVAAAEDLGRSITTIAKTVLSLVGAYTLISVCLPRNRPTRCPDARDGDSNRFDDSICGVGSRFAERFRPLSSNRR